MGEVGITVVAIKLRHGSDHQLATFVSTGSNARSGPPRLKLTGSDVGRRTLTATFLSPKGKLVPSLPGNK